MLAGTSHQLLKVLWSFSLLEALYASATERKLYGVKVREDHPVKVITYGISPPKLQCCESERRDAAARSK
jgi:hypothetical protein